MTRQKLVVANWKMNLSVPESTVLLEKYLGSIKPGLTEVAVCPSFLEIYAATKILSKTDISVGAQNVFYEDSGSFTGEISADMLRGFVKYCIVGHSERRSHFGEGDKTVAKKAAACIRHGITPIICVGENLHENMDGLTKVVVAGQVEASLADLTAEEVSRSVIAYEPVWAIGTGKVCEPEKADEVAGNIRNLIKVIFGEKASLGVRILYGGSVNEKNIKGFLVKNQIDGFLVGGSSLKSDVFSEIVSEVEASFGGAKKDPDNSKKRRQSPKKEKK